MIPRRLRQAGLCLAFALVLAGGSSGSASAQPFSNPVLTGDFPDPSVIRVGGDYWAAATSSAAAPLFPLLHSQDLLHWSVTGMVLTKPPHWAVGSYWAPQLSVWQGRYYTYYAAHSRAGPLCIGSAVASTPAGPYHDRGPLICQRNGSIDPFVAEDGRGGRVLFWKEDGNRYRGRTTIWVQRLSADGKRLVGRPKRALVDQSAWEGGLVEAPSVAQHGGWFYLFYSGNACCTPHCSYATGVARARTLFGPWERNPANPILASNEAWRCPGHGSVATDPSGRSFFLYHAFPHKRRDSRWREGLVDELTWGVDEWPSINGGSGPSTTAVGP
ncbi:MAG: hypothetical protein NVSMB25_23470 [Thermoleophilaceae bacterium]